MALRKPLVNNSGQIEQLQSGDTLDALVSGDDGLTLTNDNAGALVIGTPVYMTAADHCDKAKADAVGTVNVVGLMQPTSTATSTTGFVQTSGILTATTAQWDAVAGTTGGLTFNTFYYLSAATDGLITSTAPSTAGQFIVQIGIALSTTELLITFPQRRIKL